VVLVLFRLAAAGCVCVFVSERGSWRVELPMLWSISRASIATQVRRWHWLELREEEPRSGM